MLARTGPVRALLACLFTVAVVATAVPHAQAQSVESKRAQATELQRKIAEQGRALSLADEEFNKARIERQRIEAQATSAKDLVAAAEERWGKLRDQLGSRLRSLYMHPGAPIEAWLGARSISDLAQRHKLGSSVLAADAELVLETERARQQVMARARRLEGITASAQAKEEELASRRAEVSSAVGGQRALLANVTGEIAELMEAERERELAAARARAAQPAPDGADDASPPIIGDDRPAGPSEPDDDPEPVEPTTPPPPVKGGAGTAVSVAAQQIGKPYEWAAEGPDSFDCSGLTMYAWGKAGVSMPHSSQAQFASFPKVSKSQLQPGDLVFYGSPIHHVGIYEGGGVYINAPETGEFVRRNSIDRSDWAGAVRP